MKWKLLYILLKRRGCLKYCYCSFVLCFFGFRVPRDVTSSPSPPIPEFKAETQTWAAVAAALAEEVWGGGYRI